MNHTTVNLGFLKINQIDSVSACRIGQNVRTGVFSREKMNQGFGVQYADFCTISVPVHIVDDKDEMDSLSVIRGR